MSLFCECNSLRIAQNIQNEVSVESSIFTDIFAYQRISLKGTLNGSAKETCIVSYGTKTTKAVVVKLYHSHPSKVSEGKKKGRKQTKRKEKEKGKKEINLVDLSLYKFLGVEEAEQLENQVVLEQSLKRRTVSHCVTPNDAKRVLAIGRLGRTKSLIESV